MTGFQEKKSSSSLNPQSMSARPNLKPKEWPGSFQERRLCKEIARLVALTLQYNSHMLPRAES